MGSRISFLGAAGTVTGSRHLLERNGQRLLIDCGLFQGPKTNRLKNWNPFPAPPSEIDAVVLTHAHIDHIGYLPRLRKDGFSGRIFGTRPTLDLARILLADTAHLQEEEAKFANKRGYSKHSPALPLFTGRDSEAVFSQFEPVSFGERFEPIEGVTGQFRANGHILGAGWLDLKNAEGRKIVFSGDVGRPTDALLSPPAQPYNVDYLVMESTYGDRLHDHEDQRSTLAKAIRSGVDRGGAIIIPSFAVGRTQALLYLLRELEEAGEAPTLPVYLDSPMGSAALEVHRDHIRDLNLTCRRQFIEGIDLFKPRMLRVTSHRRDSKAINGVRGCSIIIAGSGMATGGRVLHHLKERLPDPKTTVLFIGYQAEGTRGRALREGAEKIKMFGAYVPVRAKIDAIDGFSGHADYNEMLAWMLAFNRPLKKVFLVHGEGGASEAFGKRIGDQFGWPVVLPREGQGFELEF